MAFNATTYWRKSFPVEAVRLTLENYKEISDYIGADYRINRSTGEPYIDNGLNEGHIGDWIIRKEDRYVFLDEIEFRNEFYTHDERMSSDEKYAKVYEQVRQAMVKQDAATYHQDGQGEMDLVAMQATLVILKVV